MVVPDRSGSTVCDYASYRVKSHHAHLLTSTDDHEFSSELIQSSLGCPHQSCCDIISDEQPAQNNALMCATHGKIYQGKIPL